MESFTQFDRGYGVRWFTQIVRGAHTRTQNCVVIAEHGMWPPTSDPQTPLTPSLPNQRTKRRKEWGGERSATSHSLAISPALLLPSPPSTHRGDDLPVELVGKAILRQRPLAILGEAQLHARTGGGGGEEGCYRGACNNPPSGPQHWGKHIKAGIYPPSILTLLRHACCSRHQASWPGHLPRWAAATARNRGGGRGVRGVRGV